MNNNKIERLHGSSVAKPVDFDGCCESVGSVAGRLNVQARSICIELASQK